jgi:hypothetical protein
MKTSILIFIMSALSVHFTAKAEALSPKAGFYIPDSLESVTIRYRRIENLIVLPVVINDSVTVNLILDTGCRNLILFGKRFSKIFKLQKDKKIGFSGLGSGSPVYGALSLNNKVTIGSVIGNSIPVVVVPEQNLFSNYINIHGVIGYDIFIKFEVELNSRNQTITFRPAHSAQLASDYTEVPIRIEDSRPLIRCEVVLSSELSQLCNLMIDTGSTLGLLLRTNDIDQLKKHYTEQVIGRGLNGTVWGIQTRTDKLIIGNVTMKHIKTGVIHSSWHDYASIGMDALKDYDVVLNYCKSYAGFRKM